MFILCSFNLFAAQSSGFAGQNKNTIKQNHKKVKLEGLWKAIQSNPLLSISLYKKV